LENTLSRASQTPFAAMPETSKSPSSHLQSFRSTSQTLIGEYIELASQLTPIAIIPKTSKSSSSSHLQSFFRSASQTRTNIQEKSKTTLLKTNVTLHLSSKSRIIPKLQKKNHCNHVEESSFQSSNPLFFNHKDLIHKPTATRLFRRTKMLPAKASLPARIYLSLLPVKPQNKTLNYPPTPLPKTKSFRKDRIFSKKKFTKKHANPFS
jgi:hypothetical protein